MGWAGPGCETCSALVGNPLTPIYQPVVFLRPLPNCSDTIPPPCSVNTLYVTSLVPSPTPFTVLSSDGKLGVGLGTRLIRDHASYHNMPTPSICVEHFALKVCSQLVVCLVYTTSIVFCSNYYFVDSSCCCWMLGDFDVMNFELLDTMLGNLHDFAWWIWHACELWTLGLKVLRGTNIHPSSWSQKERLTIAHMIRPMMVG